MQDPRLQQAQVYTDFSGLNALKTQARTDKQAALEQVAKQFESLFLSEMLKSMRKAGEVFAEGNYLNSNESQMYRDFRSSLQELGYTGKHESDKAFHVARAAPVELAIPLHDAEGIARPVLLLDGDHIRVSR